MSEFIRIADETGGVRRITIDRAEKLNALTRPMMAELGDAVTAAEEDPEVRSILFDSIGRVFCAGADLDGLAGEPLTRDSDPGHRFLMALAACTKPLVAAVQGAAVGVGATMLLTIDLIFASPAASLRMPFVDLGLTPEGGATILLPQRMGHARAARLLLLGESIGAIEAQAAGLLTEVVAADALAERARGAAERLAAQPPQALARTKAMMRDARLAAAMDEEQEVFQASMRGAEFRAAVEAMRQRVIGRAKPD